jgi:hypothetical protein
VRCLQLEHHNCDENGHDTVTERFDPVRFHSMATLRRKHVVTSNYTPGVVSRQLS